MKSPKDSEKEQHVTSENAKLARREKTLGRLEAFMCDAAPDGKTCDDWYEGYDKDEIKESRAWILDELNKYGWDGKFTEKVEQLYGVFTGEPGGFDKRTRLFVTPKGGRKK